MRFLFCSFTSPGYLFPMLGLALELRRRGHRVAFVSGGEAQGSLDAVEVERIPRGPADGRSFQVAAWGNPVATAVDVKHIEHGIARFAPDILVAHQLGQGAIIVREREQIPLAVMGLFSYPWPVRGPHATGAAARLAGNRRWRLEDNLRTLNEARALFRLPPVPAGSPDHPLLGDLFLLRTVPALEPELELLPPGVHAVGACLWEPAGDDEAAWGELRARFVEADAPLLYVQPGRTFGEPGFWPQLLEAVAGEPLQVVATVGRMDEPVGAVPANVVADPHVPHGPALRCARAAVTAPTTSVALACLAHGVPGVAVPTGAETPDNAEKLAELGCAVRLPARGLTADGLRNAIRRVLDDPSLRQSCERARRALADTGDFGAAAGLVERLGVTTGLLAPVAT